MSYFLEGLKTARTLVIGGDVSQLDALIAEHEAGMIETASVRVIAETR